MHFSNFKKFYFINDFSKDHISKLDKNINLIYRNYDEKININYLKKLRDFCKKNSFKIYLANNLKIAIKLKLDGFYIPSFNKKFNTKNYNFPNKFQIIGSAHNEIEIINKENQGCDLIFLAPIFHVKKKNNFLGAYRFNKLSQNRKVKLIALGGINNENIKKINLLNCYGFAGISCIKKNGLNKFRPFLNL